ncbi:MAG: hypothetical protein CBD16_01050 [Betaproteobacteria bacterium TMED156]|nr:MAG: hypothetical protein CBD16_01050 [Betaproteobacteria bacterium TMED156]
MKLKEQKDPLLPLARTIIFLLILFVVIVFFIASNKKNNEEQVKDFSVESSRLLHFYDTSEGKILITDQRGKKISVVGNEGGFMRAVLRSLAKERISFGVGPEEPFEITASKNGLISIIDPVTGRKIDVSSFGKNNAEIFTTLLFKTENLIYKEEG